MKERIWELDFIRGILLLLMFYCHFVYDIVELFALNVPADGAFYDWAMDHTGLFFILLSGVSITLGRRPVRRAVKVLLGGFACSLVTAFMYLFNFAPKGIIIYFGILHCLAVCMLLWPLFRKLPFWALLLCGGALLWLNFLIQPYQGQGNFLTMPLGIYHASFYSSDYFPLLPNLGYFLIGSGLGKVLYRKKESLLPATTRFPAPQLCFLGRHSLLVYLLHQPVIAGLVYLLSLVI